jgi:hypothetical protein
MAAAVLPIPTAVAYISPPLVLLATPQSPAHLVAGGAAVDVTVEYSCTAQSGMSIDLRVTEAVDGSIATGYGSTSVHCDGATHRTVVRVTASSLGAPFARGRGAVTTNLFGCMESPWMCGSDTIYRTIRIRR